MMTYQFEAGDFAKLLYLLNRMVGFHHQERSEDELRRFSNEVYPLLREVNHQVVGGKMSESQHVAISKSDPWPPANLTRAEALEMLTAILSK